MKAGCYLIILLSFLCPIVSPKPASCQPAGAEKTVLEGLVVGVSEGDRLTVNSFGTEIQVSLYGVVTPHTARVDKFTGWYKAGQPYAEDAFRALSIKVLHQQVQVEIRQMLVHKQNSKQMALAVIYLDGRNINLEMLSDGWGWAATRFMSRADHAHYHAVQRSARSRKMGLWLQDNPQPPWEFKPDLRIKMENG